MPLTPAGWQIAPAGREFGVAKQAYGFQGPMGASLAPDGKHLLTASSGAARIDSVDLFDIASGARTDFVPYDATKPGGPAVFYGIVYSPDGRHAWASGGGQNVVHAYDVKSSAGGAGGDRLSEVAQISTPFFPAGLAYGHTPLGDRLYVANNLSANAAGATGNPPGHQVTVIDPATNHVSRTIDLGAPLAPLGVVFSTDGTKAFVTNWLGRSVSVIDTRTESRTTDIQLSPPADPLQADHPSAIVANPREPEIYVANANSDTVSVIDPRTDALAATVDVALVPGGPKGAVPDGLAVAPDGRRLYVAEAGENAVAVLDLAHRRTIGFIPTAWYPSDVKATPDGRSIVVTNTKDSGAGPNPCGALTPLTNCPPRDPSRDAPGQLDWQYSGSMAKGSVSVIDLPGGKGLGAGQLEKLTEQVRENNEVDDVPDAKPSALAAIKHVIYVVKENRTYDQVFGDLGKGNGDPSLTLFKDDSAPNHRALARRFVTLDNFYADADISADGHNWITAASASDYVEKTWPVNYSPQPRSSERVYDWEDTPFSQQLPTEPLAGDASITRSGSAPTAGYLWDDAYAHGVSYRDYGEFTGFPGTTSPGLTKPASCPVAANVSHTTHLAARFGDHVDTAFAGYNLNCSDHTQREPEWAREFASFVARKNLPALSIVRFPSDHTKGTTVGAATPAAYVADNDLALGRLVETVSHSPYWKDTVILATEDDAQDGPDHVDAHRTVALAISPYTQRGAVDSTHYDTSSMVATIEELLGLAPMSITDARVHRMWQAFSDEPDATPYVARQPTVTPFGEPGAPTNKPGAPLATASRLATSGKPADAGSASELNAAIWKSVKGAGSAVPGGRRSG